MDNFTPTYRVYIKVNEESYITQIEGECSLSNLGGLDQPNVIKIDEGEGERFYHAQGRYLEKPITDFATGCYNYKYIDNEVVEVSDEEKAAIVAEREEAARQAEQERIANDPTTLAMEMLIDQDLRLTMLEMGIEMEV